MTTTRAAPANQKGLDNHPGAVALAHLQWPWRARIGLVAWLLYQMPSELFTDWLPPPDETPAETRRALGEALGGEEIEAEAPPIPLEPLRKALDTVDDRLLTLLTVLGSEAVAEDPGLPLRLMPSLAALPALAEDQRRLLGVRIQLEGREGQASGFNPGADHAVVGGLELGPLRTDWSALVPSQLVLPKDLLTYRHLRGELLYGAREVPAPTALRPLVLVLDTTPPTFGPVEKMIRPAAFQLARHLFREGLPVTLITVDDEGRARPLQLAHPADLLEIWTARTLHPFPTEAALALAEAVRSRMAEPGQPEAVTVLFSQPFCGEELTSAPSHLRAFFAHHPGLESRPTLAGLCERWVALQPDQGNQLPRVLARLAT